MEWDWLWAIDKVHSPVLNWFRRNPKRGWRLLSRFLEMLREIGVLLTAFAPLEAGIRSNGLSNSDRGTMLVFFVIGVALFALGALGDLGVKDVR
jgi:hypothetical protein